MIVGPEPDAVLVEVSVVVVAVVGLIVDDGSKMEEFPCFLNLADFCPDALLFDSELEMLTAMTMTKIKIRSSPKPASKPLTKFVLEMLRISSSLSTNLKSDNF